MFQYGLTSTLNKPTRVNRNRATIINNFFANLILNNEVKAQSNTNTDLKISLYVLIQLKIIP